MVDKSWEPIIPGGGPVDDTSQDFEPIVPGVGVVNEGDGGGAPPVGRPLPQRVLSGPFAGPLGGPF